MKNNQKVVFGCLGLLATAYVVMRELGENIYILLLFAVLAAALLTLATVRKIVYTVIQVSCDAIGDISKGASQFCYMIADWSEARRTHLLSRPRVQTSSVPAWGDPKLQTASAATASVEDLDVPDATQEGTAKQKDAGLNIILEPR